jgi:uncharacterized membrane protein YphA (DoxX/SURF4 family)
MKSSLLPARIAAGAYILHAGLEKWNGEEATAQGVHGMAKGTYPFLDKVPPTRFLRLLAAGEVAIGAALAAPFVPSGLAGAGLTAFSGGLLGMYARTPGMRKERSIWPTPQGIGISKDVWLFGIGLTLIAESVAQRRRAKGSR